MTKTEYRDADSHTTVRIHNPTHERIHEHNRESETLAATIDRALDAQALLSHVTELEETETIVQSLSTGVADGLTDDIDYEGMVPKSIDAATDSDGYFNPEVFGQHLMENLRVEIADSVNARLSDSVETALYEAGGSDE